MAKQTAKGSKKGRKIGRDTEKCKKYRAEGRREKNKARKAAKCARVHDARVAKGARRAKLDG
jgi:hypothetical protein